MPEVEEEVQVPVKPRKKSKKQFNRLILPQQKYQNEDGLKTISQDYETDPQYRYYKS